ncbi:putative Ig domain-containing protein [Protaetiibacter larvae]|uniref:InlB B-repeat-containing protein n=1 Tax=Protaetiibacter larvae TaxID=2592654 RepID=A0A5C1Y8H5_9MICO|nr:putative Ig domain-containing protein [Protaetiibacter larvae]QEO09469.1 InlB B-repeat-containing protein [Protaetiibacter larvae]
MPAHTPFRRVALVLATTAALSAGVLVPATAASAASSVATWNDLATAVNTATTGTVEVTLGADITAPYNGSLLIASGVGVVFDLNGHTLSILNPGMARAAFGVRSGASLTINDSSTPSTGALVAVGISGLAPGIGGYNESGGSITITGGTITATGGGLAAGIGGIGVGSQHITITGGNVTAIGGEGGAGIGGGWHGSGSNLRITGGTVTATGGEGGAGIGGGGEGGGGVTFITGGTVTATGGAEGAGIGGGSHGNAWFTAIEGGTVIATGGSGGAGIGGGLLGDGRDTSISGGTVTANGGSFASGIGGGNDGDGGTTEIIGGTVTATGGAGGGAGIGGGEGGGAGVTILSGGDITATGRSGGAGIGTGFTSGLPGLSDGTLDIRAQSPAPGSTFTGGSSTSAIVGGRGSVATFSVVPTDPFAKLTAVDAASGSVHVEFGWGVTFALNGGDGTAPAVQVIDFGGGTATRPADPTRTGGEFVAWTTGGTPYDFTTPVTGNVALTAQWNLAPTLAGAASATATVGEPFSWAPTTVTGTPDAVVSLTDGELPDGLTLDPGTGAITGTPSDAAGDYPVTLGAHNGIGADASLELTISLAPGEPTSLALRAATGTVNQGDTVTFTATGTDAAGNSFVIPSGDLTLSSSVASDIIRGTAVSFPHASPHLITATHTPSGVSATLLVEVTPAALARTGVDADTISVLAALALLVLLAGAGLLTARRRA